MKKLTSILITLLFAFNVEGQSKNYKEYEVCISSELYKGKRNHGKPHCVGWGTVREYKDGRKDTISWYGGGKMFIGDEYEQYKQLPERGKYIVDSLKEDGIPLLQDSYLTYEPIYMKAGRKIEKSYKIIGGTVIIYKYLFWKNKNSNGIQLISDIVID